MNQRHERQDVERILLGHRPLSFRIVSRRISNCAEKANEQVRKPLLAQCAERFPVRLGWSPPQAYVRLQLGERAPLLSREVVLS